MIAECPVNMECKLVQVVELPSNYLFIGEIVGAYCEEGCMTGGKPDIGKVDPFLLTMTDSRYRAVGEHIGDAWSSGKKLKS
jgi:flavin reductase (DIM6/NTAB) family NADH-FMN oxidoreductase RutF